MPNALASVDHPFHAARFGELLEALDHGHAPRWIAEHQGGYPSEFYPFGGTLLDLAVWLATLGQLNTPMVHTWAVAITFALPAIGFLWLCSLAGVSPWAGVAALAAHLCIRGWWWSGGSHELIEWGLFTNVLAAYLMFLALIGLIQLDQRRNWRWALLPALLIGWGIWTNPRSLIAVAVIAVALAIVRGLHRRDVRRLTGPALAIGVSLLLAAPLLVSLLRFDDLYYFVHFEGYEGSRNWLDSSVQAVSLPVFIVALVGLAVAIRPGSTELELILGYTFLIYSGVTLWLVEIDWPRSLIQQLETTRLMPFQRLLMIALATVALGRAFEWLVPRYRTVAGVAVACLIPILYVIATPSWIPSGDRGLVREGTMASAGIAELRTSIELADDAAADSTALLILGTTDFWHDHLWATLWSDRRFFYDDWLWYWQQEHVGDFDPDIENSYPHDSSAIDEGYLRTHGIGAVIVTGQAREAAASAPFLNGLRTGAYDVYLVSNATTLATLDGSSVATDEGDDRIGMTDAEAGGKLTIRQNWFPRWQATGDGRPLEVVHRPDGYMDIVVPAGTIRVELVYAADSIDWMGRILAGIGVALVLTMLLWPRPTARSELR